MRIIKQRQPVHSLTLATGTLADRNSVHTQLLRASPRFKSLCLAQCLDRLCADCGNLALKVLSASKQHKLKQPIQFNTFARTDHRNDVCVCMCPILVALRNTGTNWSAFVIFKIHIGQLLMGVCARVCCVPRCRSKVICPFPLCCDR